MSELNENESYDSSHRSDSDDYCTNILGTQQINQYKQEQGIQRPKKLPKKILWEQVDLDFVTTEPMVGRRVLDGEVLNRLEEVTLRECAKDSNRND
jgi:hypothetical protein